MLQNIYSNILVHSTDLLLAADLPSGSIVSFDKRLLLTLGIQLFNVVLLAFVLTFILYKPVRRFLRDRTERIQNEVVSAKTEMQNAQKLKAEYEAKLNDIEKEREEILNLARKKALERCDQILADARKEADAAYNAVMAELELEKKNREDEMKSQLVELSSLIAGRFVAVSMDETARDKFVDEAIAGWEESLWQN